MEVKTDDVRSRRKNEFGEEFVVEVADREERQFDTDAPDVMAMMMAHIDWLAEQGCHLEAELMMIDWSLRIGNLAGSKHVFERQTELRKYFGIKDKRLVHKQVDAPRGRKQTITLFLEDPMGCYYTKATVNLLHVEQFVDRLHGEPLMSLLLACNGTTAPALVSKYLNYPWLKKCAKLEFNNLEIGYVQLRELFKNTAVRPLELVITGRQKQLPTIDQLKILPLTCASLKDLWNIDYHGVRYDYRLDPNKQD